MDTQGAAQTKSHKKTIGIVVVVALIVSIAGYFLFKKDSGQSTGLGTDTALSQQAPGSSQQAGASAAPDSCFTVSFRHPDAGKKFDEETFLNQKHMIEISDARVNPKSVCIKVNNRAVAYDVAKGSTNQFLLKAIAGPNAEIVAHYCTGKAQCKVNCKIQKDDFMSAIGGSDDTDALPVVQWDSGSKGLSKEEADAEKEVGALRRELAGQVKKGSIYKGWIKKDETRACQEGSA